MVGDSAVERLFPKAWPVAVRGCVACANLVGERDRAERRVDGSAVADANVRMRRHQLDSHR
jgi:hypothetical protein